MKHVFNIAELSGEVYYDGESHPVWQFYCSVDVGSLLLTKSEIQGRLAELRQAFPLNKYRITLDKVVTSYTEIDLNEE